MGEKRKYELVAIFDAGLSEEATREQMEKIGVVAREHGGAVVSEEIWGRRRLAYRIKKREYGVYVVMVLEGGQTLVSDLDRQLRINESVLRHLIVKKDKYAPDFVKRRSEEEDVFLGAPISAGEFDSPEAVEDRTA